MKTTEEIKSVLEPLLIDGELFIVSISVSRDNKIEVLIDSPAGVNINTCIELSRKIEEKLNREEEDFELTVGSAGIGYPFVVEGQYRKNIGKPVEIKLKDSTQLCGILKAYDGKQIQIEYEEKKSVEGKKKKEIVRTERDILLDDISQIKDVVSF